jgi:transposase
VDSVNACAEGVITPKTRVPYSPEIRRQMADLVRAGHDLDDLAREFEPTVQSIRNWIVQSNTKKG